MNPWDSQSARVYRDTGAWHSLNANNSGGQSRDSVFCLQGNGINRADTAGCEGAGWRTGQSYTLNTIDIPAVCAFTQNQRDEVRDLKDIAGALAAEPGMKQQNFVAITTKAAGFKSGQGYQARGIGYQEEVAPTLPSEAGGNSVPAVFENHSQDSRYKPLGDTSETVSAKYGTGGNNQPLVVEPLPFDTTQVTSDKNWSNPKQGDPCHPLAAGAHPPAAVITFDKEMYNAGERMTGGMQARYDNVAPTVRADSHPSGVCTSVVRRLTPMECERLQGYPDGWTDIGDWTDSKGKKRKAADGPRYKALGNSIALPFWQFLARRICAQYERDITLGSLFDGIGGFPYVFERCGAKAVWASEIEEFVIAVTKKQFPETGE